MYDQHLHVRNYGQYNYIIPLFVKKLYFIQFVRIVLKSSNDFMKLHLYIQR